jgi:hypothetical protein
LLIKVFIAHYQGNDGVMILMSTNGFHTVLPNRKNFLSDSVKKSYKTDTNLPLTGLFFSVRMQYWCKQMIGTLVSFLDNQKKR